MPVVQRLSADAVAEDKEISKYYQTEVSNTLVL
jgi:hypothetical protein